MEYSKTVYLPKTDFPMRANLSQREPETLKHWQALDLYKKIIERNKDKSSYILHDGPPYANGNIHIGHALNKILKDIIIKYKSMRGYYTPFVPGWDCHGMPIEHKVIELLGEKHKQMSKIEIRKECKNYALKHIEIQKQDFKRLGCIAEWDNPYLTLLPEYEAAIIQMFGELVEKNFIYKGLKPVHWCSKCETALADAEVEYSDHTSPSIYVRFKVCKKNDIDLPDNTYFIIWTTTPWTIPANVGIALHPDFTYNLIRINDAHYICVNELSERIIDKFSEEGNITSFLVRQFKGAELKGIECLHPFISDRISKVINGMFVTLDTGSGCVHIAPGHGEDDFIIGKEYNLPVISPVDNRGCFTSDFKEMQGKFVFAANKEIIELLKTKKALIGAPENIQHSYPHCWRCKSPIIFRATYQWFLKVDHLDLRKRLLDAVETQVQWVPNWGKERIRGMLITRPDWCLSRQRSWGVPIPVMYCKHCNQPLLDKKNIDHFQNLVAKHGVDCWFEFDEKQLLPENTKCPNCGASEFTKETDILDVWFDSGASHIAVLEQRNYLRSPADIYLEGSDQHRGWFQLSMIPAVAIRNRPPFKTVLTHGFVVDEKGQKMSKQLGNVVTPKEIIDKFGADILRLWVAYEDYRNDVSIGADIINRLIEAYKKIRNTLRFLLGCLNDFDFQKNAVEYPKLLEIDKWMLAQLFALQKKVTENYEEFKFHSIYHNIFNFCIKELSAFYLDIIKERIYLYSIDSTERRAAQTVVFEILKTLTHLLAPILSFTAEEVIKYYPAIVVNKESIFLNDWQTLKSEFENNKIIEDWIDVLSLRDDVLKTVEITRKTKDISQPLETKITVFIKDIDKFAFFNNLKDELRAILICSELELREYVDDLKDFDYSGAVAAVIVDKLNFQKCARCWKFKPSVNTIENFPNICADCAKIIKNDYK